MINKNKSMNADGQVVQHGVVSTESSTGEETYTLSNGQQVPLTGSDGSTVNVQYDGSVVNALVTDYGVVAVA